MLTIPRPYSYRKNAIARYRISLTMLRSSAEFGRLRSLVGGCYQHLTRFLDEARDIFKD
jgi:hypothetical protein